MAGEDEGKPMNDNFLALAIILLCLATCDDCAGCRQNAIDLYQGAHCDE